VVDWLFKNVELPGRKEATDLGQKLFEMGILVHVAGKNSFKDGHYFYRLTVKPLVLPSTQHNTTQPYPSHQHDTTQHNTTQHNTTQHNTETKQHNIN